MANHDHIMRWTPQRKAAVVKSIARRRNRRTDLRRTWYLARRIELVARKLSRVWARWIEGVESAADPHNHGTSAISRKDRARRIISVI